jgi:uncharacterized protein
MGVARLDYVELPVSDCAVSKCFFETAFGWTLTEFGPTYASTTTGDVDIGLDGTPGEAVAAPLAVIRVDDLEAARSDVIAAGGTLTRDIFAFPGGRRFHFREPGGCELAVWVTD